MTGGSHEKEQRQGQPGADLRYQKGLPAHTLGFFWNGSALLGKGPRPQNDALLDPPYEAPDVEQQHPANAAANPYAQQSIAFPAVVVEVNVKVAGRGYIDGDQNAKHQPAIERPFQGHDQPVFNGKRHRPNEEKTPDSLSWRGLGIAGVSAYDHHPVGDARQHSYQGAPAEPPQGTAHQGRHHLHAQACIHLLQGRVADQVEKIEQPDPGDPGHKMYPAEYDLSGSRATRGQQGSQRNRGRAGHSCLQRALVCLRRADRSRRLYRFWMRHGEVENRGLTPYRTCVPRGLAACCAGWCTSSMLAIPPFFVEGKDGFREKRRSADGK